MLLPCLIETTTGRCAGRQLIPVVREFMENYQRDAVADEIVNEFLCDLPPTTNQVNLMQSGEPSDYHLNPCTGRSAPAYITFQHRDGQWYYCGCCFEGETVESDKMTGATV